MPITDAGLPRLPDGAAVALEQLPRIFSYGQAREAGLSRRRIYWLRDHDVLEALGAGTYRRADSYLGEDPDLVEIAVRAPLATLCLTTALVRHDLSDTIAGSIDVALPRGQRHPKTAAPVSWHAFVRDTFALGREPLRVGELSLGLYTPERSIVDAFRLRHQEGSEIVYEALRRWLRRPASSPASLTRMAQAFPKAEPALRAALEALL